MSKKALVPVNLPVFASDPTYTAVAGDLYYNSTSNTVRAYDGTKWVASGIKVSQPLTYEPVQGTVGIQYDGNLEVVAGALKVTDTLQSIDRVYVDTAATPAVSVAGLLQWNDGDGTLDLGLKGGNVTLQVGQETLVRVFNDEATTLNDGEIVYISGAQGNRVAVRRASNSTEAASSATLGMVTEPIVAGTEGFITRLGSVNKLNTFGIPEGTVLWLGSTPGTYTTTRPTAPANSVRIGWVAREHATVGSIFVDPQNGFELDELHNVVISGIANNDVLIYDSAQTVWRNKPQSSIQITNSQVSGLGTAALLDAGVQGGVATLDSGGKVPVTQLPASAIAETFVVASESEMLALTAQVGDIAVRTDVTKSFILQAEPASTLSNWVELLVPSAVQGTTGAQGIQGTQGPQGTTGIQGANGTQGLIGADGIQGAQGVQGPQGTRGIQGLTGVQGLQGVQGPQGTEGIQGFEGIQGTQGAQGEQGIQGVQGTQGLQGIQGLLGLQGVGGLQGTQGVQGTDGIQGTDGPTGSQGVQGTAGYIGADGAQGTQGITGSQGATGAQGVQGVQGTQGVVGNAGVQGAQGIQGLTGAQGAQGLQGTLGAQGASGIQGAQGVQGVQGTTGTQGLQGTQGTQGTVGPVGSQGIQGTTGAQGTMGSQGTSGLNGSQGTTGSQGATGTQGATGAQGITGSQGTQGIQGTTGLQGLTGTQGTSGLQGTQGIIGTGSIVFSSDTPPASPAAGTFWYKTDTGQAFIYYDFSWVEFAVGPQGPAGQASLLRWKKTAVGGETTLSGNDDVGAPLTYTVNKELLYLNGVLLVRGADYTATTGTTITGLTALTAGDTVEILAFGEFVLTSGISATIFDASGDIIIASAPDTAMRLAIGGNGQTLIADSSQTGRMRWGDDLAIMQIMGVY